MKNVFTELRQGNISAKCGHCQKWVVLDSQGRIPAHENKLIGKGHGCPGAGAFIGITQCDVERGRVN